MLKNEITPHDGNKCRKLNNVNILTRGVKLHGDQGDPDGQHPTGAISTDSSQRPNKSPLFRPCNAELRLTETCLTRDSEKRLRFEQNDPLKWPEDIRQRKTRMHTTHKPRRKN